MCKTPVKIPQTIEPPGALDSRHLSQFYSKIEKLVHIMVASVVIVILNLKVTMKAAGYIIKPGVTEVDEPGSPGRGRSRK